MHNLMLLFSFFTLTFILSDANHQTRYLHTHLKSNTFSSSPSSSLLHPRSTDQSPVFVGPQHGLMQADKITHLPGQPHAVDFDHYAGYVTVDPKAGRALFYYFVESPTNSSTNPLVLWLNGGPWCSSVGYGAMEELGPFRVNSDGRTLFRNNYAWNNVANVIFLESPAGVGFSYSNTSADYNNTSDATTANDAYTFLINWLERFPQYKTRDFYITGESYAGHYVPQLAHTILLNNNNTIHTLINLKGIAMGNALVDDKPYVKAFYEHLWSHALISDETHGYMLKYCNFVNDIESDQCSAYTSKADYEFGYIDQYNIYAPMCQNPVLKNGSSGSIDLFDPCSDIYVDHYLNIAEVQSALHVKPTTWEKCKFYGWTDWQHSVLPTIENLMASGLRIWLYSGDMDGNVPVTYTKYVISSLKLPIETAWRPWYFENEVGGYVVGYKGLTFVTVRGAGHAVPSYQPQRALAMISSFLHGNQPPSS